MRRYSHDAVRVLRSAVPSDGFCVLTLDPATMLPTGEVVENGLPPEAMARMAEIEVGEQDFNKFPALAQAPQPAATLSQATGGDLDRSLRHRELRQPSGLGDELRAALVAESVAWGALSLLRGSDVPAFTQTEADTVAAVSRELGEGLRRITVRGPRPGAEADLREPVGVLVLEPDNSIAMANPTAEAWLAETSGSATIKRLPGVVNAVASRARAADADTGAEALARVRTPAGTWLVVHGSALGEGSDARVAVIVEPASTPELAPLAAAAYGLTERERAVTQLVAQGFDTSEIASRLHLSTWTVQDHLKAIFEKTGVRTRGELVARLFFDHHAPRLTAPRPPA